MRVLVLGAGGFIGRRIVAALTRRHGPDCVIAGLRRTLPSEEMPGVKQRLIDAEDARSLRSAIGGVTHIINSVMGSESAIIESARNVGSLVRDGAIERAVHLSSIAVFGIRSGVIGENDPLGPPADGYARAKIDAERSFAEGAGDGGVILRPGLVYGSGSTLWIRRIGRLVAAGRLGPLGPTGEGTCALVHVDDVADAAVASCGAANVEGRAFTLVAGSAPSWNTYFADMAAAMGVASRPVSLLHLRFERALAYPLTALNAALGRSYETVTPGLVRLFDVQATFESSAVGTLLLDWRDYPTHLRESAAWLGKKYEL